jgi:hypothetical protein
MKRRANSLSTKENGFSINSIYRLVVMSVAR